MKLFLQKRTYYRVKRGQTAREIACAFSCPLRALIAYNGLSGEPEEGQILKIPPARNLYIVRGGESQTLLCGSAEQFEKRNGTKWLYPMQEIFL